jgi:hypothetical protein
MASFSRADQTLTHYPDVTGKGARYIMPSDAIALIAAFGFFMALCNAYILSLVPTSGTPQDFQIRIELDIKGGNR